MSIGALKKQMIPGRRVYLTPGLLLRHITCSGIPAVANSVRLRCTDGYRKVRDYYVKTLLKPDVVVALSYSDTVINALRSSHMLVPKVKNARLSMKYIWSLQPLCRSALLYLQSPQHA